MSLPALLPALLLLAADPPRGAVALETYLHQGRWQRGALTVVSPALFARLAASDRVSLEAGWSFALAASEERTVFEPGNPFVGLNARLLDGPVAVQVMAAVGLPWTLLRSPDELGRAGLLRAAALRGNGTYGLFAPGMASLVPGGSITFRPARAVALDLTTRLPLALAPDGAGRLRAGAALQATVGAEVEPLPPLALGLRFLAIYVLTAPPGADPTQLSLTPFARLQGPWGFLEARATVNLDSPLGPGPQGEGVFSAALAAGASF